MPANYRLEIHKHFIETKWCNTWLIGALDMDDGEAIANAIVNFERKIHKDVVTFDYFLLSTILVADRVFRHRAINLQGLASSDAEVWLPLFNTVRVDFNTMDSDPCRKYFRTPISESNQADGELTTAYQAVIQAEVNSTFFTTIAGDNLFSPAGNVVISGTVHKRIQERQLRRRRKKKVVPAP